MNYSIYRCRQWTDDLDETIHSLPILDHLSGASVFITGATGLIGSAITDILLRYNGSRGNSIRIYAAGRSEKRAEARFGDRIHNGALSFVPYDAAISDNCLNVKCDYIIHGAGNSTPDKMTEEPVETMLCNFIGMKNLLDYAKRNRVTRTLYISSSEIYGQKGTANPLREDEYGYVDLLNPRNSYSNSKRATETLCVSYLREYGVESVIVRPGHIYGPTASENDARVASAWAYAAAKGEPIVMKSDGAQLRSYCYCLDCASAILTVLLKGRTGCAYNISHPGSVVTIREMAQLLAQAGNVPLKQQLPSQQERIGFNPMNNSSLDSTLLESLGWHGLFDADRGFRHTVRILQHYYSDPLTSRQ